jgi:stage II sporulation protein E
MVSDGAVHTGTDWLKSELNGIARTDMQKLCEKIAITAKMRRGDGHDDDMTVLAASLKKGG